MHRFAAYLSLLTLVIVTPFERWRPFLSLPGQQISNVEFAMAAAVGIWLGCLVWTRSAPRWRTPVTGPWLVWLGVLAIAAVASAAHQLDALKIVARLAAGFVVFTMAVTALGTEERAAVTMAVALGTAAAVALVAVLEFSGVAPVLHWLNQYRDGVRVVGGKVRAGGTLQYPTIAAMYFEIAFAFGLGCLLWLWDAPAALWPHRRWAIGLVVAALALIGEALTLTFTRTAFVGLAAAAIVVARHRVRRMSFDGGARAVAGLTAAALFLPLVSWSDETVRLRLSSEGRQGWYRASFQAPETLTLTAGSDTSVPVIATNTGRVTWHPASDAPFHVSYHWLAGDSDNVVQFDGARADLPGDVAPEASAAVDVPVRAPHLPGHYRLAWDVVQEHRLWFATEPGNSLALTDVVVDRSTVPVAPLPAGRGPRVLPPPTVVSGRLDLWRAALDVARAHPWLGVGPDNFRFTYGAFLGLANADTRVHANDMYLELLAGGGLFGLGAFALLAVRAGVMMSRTTATLSPRASALYAGVIGAGAAVLVHGLLDSFLTFTPTYLAMAVMLGLAAAPGAWKGVALADRI